MTTKKDFKRAVREYATRHGLSYATARQRLEGREKPREGEEGRHERDGEKGGAALRRVTNDEYGFTVSLPDGWSEFPRPFSSSPFEVARYAHHDGTTRVCMVFRMPGSPGLHPGGMAERSRTKLEKKGFTNFVVRDVEVAGRSCVLLTCDKMIEKRPWAAREYFVPAGSLVYCLGLASGDPEGDRGRFDAMAEGFDVAASQRVGPRP